ncbi:MAG: hypothetical protein QGI16_01490 [Candidatus Marinimicrobia bacterium]|jgi:rubrerythrin|nr:hypothetical protein [Candidatus Neomarinimicrobiota bacterium]MDP6569200.1 hypothetical protein [Candidatus Neomarinimicrobiota bacterium]MDP7025583.1 hypothetical protein [Candidatus Neomarinimicrobiota bacterium]
MQYLFWLVLAALFVLFAGTLYWSSRRNSVRSNAQEKDLEEWTCPTCGFQVQMGTECIYCGEKKSAF